MTAPAHIALIGCGFTGTSAFFQLVNRYPVEEITIFEATGEFGPGYPYRTDECQDYLINNTADTMCLVPSNRGAFVAWLRDHPDLAPDFDERGHLPRAIFGKFLKDAFGATRTAAAIKGIKVHLVPFEATTMREDVDGRVHIGWAEGETVTDTAILTTGRCPDVDRYPHPLAGSPAQYVANHIMSSALDSVPLDATLHILGASLSAYDVINRLFSAETGCRFVRDTDGALKFEPGPNDRHAVLCSRSGRLKWMQTQSPAGIERTRFTPQALRDAAGFPGLRLADVAAIVRKEAKNHGAEIDWNAVVDPYGGCTSKVEVNARAAALLNTAIDAAKSAGPDNFLVDFFADAQIDLWDAFAGRYLAAGDERAYRDKIETAALCYAAPRPIPTAEKLLALHRAGQLSVVKGVRDVTLSDDGCAYEIVHSFGTEIANILVNTTGTVDRNVESSQQPDLIRNLTAEGLLSRYARDGITMQGVSVDMTTFRASSARNTYIANMLLWGPGFFTSSAFMMATIVERLLQAMFCERQHEIG